MKTYVNPTKRYRITRSSCAPLPALSISNVIDDALLFEGLNDSLDFFYRYYPRIHKLLCSSFTTVFFEDDCGAFGKHFGGRCVMPTGELCCSRVVVSAARHFRKAENIGATFTHEFTHAVHFQGGMMAEPYRATEEEVDFLVRLGFDYGLDNPRYPADAMSSGEWVEPIARSFELLHLAWKHGHLSFAEAEFRRKAPSLWRYITRLAACPAKPVEYYNHGTNTNANEWKPIVKKSGVDLFIKAHPTTSITVSRHVYDTVMANRNYPESTAALKDNSLLSGAMPYAVHQDFSPEDGEPNWQIRARRKCEGYDYIVVLSPRRSAPWNVVTYWPVHSGAPDTDNFALGGTYVGDHKAAAYGKNRKW